MPHEFQLNQAIEILERTPSVLRAWLPGLSTMWTESDYGPDTFTVRDVIGHLLHCEHSDWIPRVRRILEDGDSIPFDPLDRYAQFEESRGRTLPELVDAFAAARATNLATLRELDLGETRLNMQGKHPAFGAVTLRQLLATWAVHDLNHLAQIAKAMATQYADAVGPWRDYLSILKTPGTRMDPEGAARARAAREKDS
jgi:uncharacterized damage-inducible protein DinB